MIAGKQIPACSNAAISLESIRLDVRAVEQDLRRAGLDQQASEMGCLAEHVYELASQLERLAREAFVAARRGEE